MNEPRLLKTVTNPVNGQPVHIYLGSRWQTLDEWAAHARQVLSTTPSRYPTPIKARPK